jgi:hypothetical protein
MRYLLINASLSLAGAVLGVLVILSGSLLLAVGLTIGLGLAAALLTGLAAVGVALAVFFGLFYAMMETLDRINW